ncbi:hypothetical protein I4U23_027067 [Adineta vaga]|nr:hypothetical protein I4U23_027067 [Adineta vaga]
MPPPCAIDTCKRKSRASCYCCNKELCIDHLKEHDESINLQIHPLVDELNSAADQLPKINMNNIIMSCRQKLDTWRDDCYNLINQIYQDKCEELKERCTEKMNKQQKQIDEIRIKMNDLIREKEATYEDIPSLKSTINEIKRDIDQFGKRGVIVDTRPLIINRELIYIENWSSDEVKSSSLTSPFQTIECSNDEFPIMVANKQFFLLSRQPNLTLYDRDLTLVKESSWKYDPIFDICWSSTLINFIIITKTNEIFLMEENLTSVQSIETIEKQKWLSLTCSDASLFLTTNENGSNIYEFNLLSSFRLIKQWKSRKSCGSDEFIRRIAHNNQTLALLIRGQSNGKIRIELRLSSTLDSIWSCTLCEGSIKRIIVRRQTMEVSSTDIQMNDCICSLKCDEWLALDCGTSPRFLSISKDGKLKETCNYESKPYNVVLFDSNILAIRTSNYVNFYRV